MKPAASLSWRLSSFRTLLRLYSRLGQTSQTINKGFVSVLVPCVHSTVHEASCLALLEAVLFHRDAVEAVQETGPDLTDY